MSETEKTPQPTEWEKTDAALRAIKKLIWFMHENKPPDTKAPKKKTPEEIAWHREMDEVRKWAIQIGQRRIEVCMKNVVPAKLHYK